MADGTSGPRSGGVQVGMLGSCPSPIDPRGRCSPWRSSSTSSRPALPAPPSAGRSRIQPAQSRSRGPSVRRADAYDAATRPHAPRTLAEDDRETSARIDPHGPAVARTGEVAAVAAADIPMAAQVDWIDRPTPDVPEPKARAGFGRRAGIGRLRRQPVQLQGSQPRLDPGAGRQPVGLVLLLLVQGVPGRPGLSLGLCGRQQRLPVRTRPQRLQVRSTTHTSAAASPRA